MLSGVGGVGGNTVLSQHLTYMWYVPAVQKCPVFSTPITASRRYTKIHGKWKCVPYFELFTMLTGNRHFSFIPALARQEISNYAWLTALDKCKQNIESEGVKYSRGNYIIIRWYQSVLFGWLFFNWTFIKGF